MRRLIILLGLLTLFSCENKKPKQTKSAEHSFLSYNAQDTTHVINGLIFSCDGPRGGVFIGKNEDEISYRIFRIHISNNTSIPLGLNIEFPSASVFLLPDSTVELEISILPDSMIPTSIKDTFDFGVKNASSFFESKIRSNNYIEIDLPPFDKKVVYTGIRFKSQIENGLTRSIMFLNGQKKEAAFLPKEWVQNKLNNNDSMNLVYGVAVAPPNYYDLIPCGKVYLNKKE